MGLQKLQTTAHELYTSQLTSGKHLESLQKFCQSYKYICHSYTWHEKRYVPSSEVHKSMRILANEL